MKFAIADHIAWKQIS